MQSSLFLCVSRRRIATGCTKRQKAPQCNHALGGGCVVWLWPAGSGRARCGAGAWGGSRFGHGGYLDGNHFTRHTSTTDITGNHIEGTIAGGDITHADRASPGVGNHYAGSVGGTNMPRIGQGACATGSDAIDDKGDFVTNPFGSGIARLGDKANGWDGEVDFGVA